MINREQLKDKVVRPTLKRIPRGFSDKAELAIMMIVAHESKGGQYLAQMGNGPAMGIIQMEDWVHDDTWNNSDSIWHNALQLGFVSPVEYEARIKPKAELLYTDLAYNVFMARQRLFMDPNPLPSDPMEISHYLKKYWNSDLGAAKPDSYYNDYMGWS